jgi:uncharacterized protein DUF4913
MIDNGVTRNPNADSATPPTMMSDEIIARFEELAALVTELTRKVEERETQASAADGQKPLYDDVESWVRGYLLVNFTRPFGETGTQRWYWCEQWWRHNEAVTALTALWYAWEHARLETTGMIGWLHEAHYHLGVICSVDGPFRQCKPADGDRPALHTGDRFADVVAAPADWWNWWAEDE